MDNETEIHLFLSDEVVTFLADNNLDFVDLLNHEGVAVTKKLVRDTSRPLDQGTKEPARILIASAALALSLTPLITKILSAFTRKSIVVTVKELRPIEDSAGNAVLDKSGDPILYWVPVTRIVESGKEGERDPAIAIKGPLGIEISYGSKKGE